jgi:integral membrane protein (TIGR01906 family)
MASVSSTAPQRLAGVLTAIATAIVIIAISILPFLSPQWVSFEQGRAQAQAWTGFSSAALQTATGAILSDLVFGPPSFDVEVNGTPVLNVRERSHMRDVRGVFAGFFILALVAGVGLVAAFIGARRLGHPERAWRAIRNGARGLAVGVVIAGAVAAVAFDALFEVFHRMFFPGGTYLFDPATDRLVQLFPFAFWSETTMVVGGLILLISVGVFAGASRRASATQRPAPMTATLARPETVR